MIRYSKFSANFPPAAEPFGNDGWDLCFSISMKLAHGLGAAAAPRAEPRLRARDGDSGLTQILQRLTAFRTNSAEHISPEAASAGKPATRSTGQTDDSAEKTGAPDGEKDDEAKPLSFLLLSLVESARSEMLDARIREGQLEKQLGRSFRKAVLDKKTEAGPFKDRGSLKVDRKTEAQQAGSSPRGAHFLSTKKSLAPSLGLWPELPSRPSSESRNPKSPGPASSTRSPRALKDILSSPLVPVLGAAPNASPRASPLARILSTRGGAGDSNNSCARAISPLSTLGRALCNIRTDPSFGSPQDPAAARLPSNALPTSSLELDFQKASCLPVRLLAVRAIVIGIARCSCVRAKILLKCPSHRTCAVYNTSKVAHVHLVRRDRQTDRERERERERETMITLHPTPQPNKQEMEAAEQRIQQMVEDGLRASGARRSRRMS